MYNIPRVQRAASDIHCQPDLFHDHLYTNKHSQPRCTSRSSINSVNHNADSVSHPFRPTHPLRTLHWWKRATFCTGSLLTWPFQPPIRVLLFVARAIGVAAGSSSKASVKQSVCTVSTKEMLAGQLAGWRRGRTRKRAPVTSSVPRKKGLVSRSWRVLPGCDVSHFRTDGTMRWHRHRRHHRHLSSPPFLSCQMNACSLGYRTEEVIHQK